MSRVSYSGQKRESEDTNFIKDDSEVDALFVDHAADANNPRNTMSCSMKRQLKKRRTIRVQESSSEVQIVEVEADQHAPVAPVQAAAPSLVPQPRPDFSNDINVADLWRSGVWSSCTDARAAHVLAEDIMTRLELDWEQTNIANRINVNLDLGVRSGRIGVDNAVAMCWKLVSTIACKQHQRQVDQKLVPSWRKATFFKLRRLMLAPLLLPQGVGGGCQGSRRLIHLRLGRVPSNSQAHRAESIVG